MKRECEEKKRRRKRNRRRRKKGGREVLCAVLVLSTHHLCDTEAVSEVMEWIVAVVFLHLQLIRRGE